MPGEGFKALADPTRRRILELLREGNCTAGELAEHFDISKPSLSHHLATLKNAGLVTDERHGQNIVYSLNTTVMQDLIGWLWALQTRKVIRMNNENKGIHATGVSRRVWIVLIALCVANVVAHLMVMPSLPAQIPTHWGANGAVDGVGV